MPYSVRIIQLLDKVEPALREVLLEILSEIESQRKQWEESVTKSEFNELKAIVAELAEAQKKTEQRLDQLAEAQKKTERRLDQLAEAQKKTEQRLDQLAEAQKKTEERLNQLAEAQKKTEEELRKLIGEHKKTRKMLGGLTHTVGYVLEDRAYFALPHLLKRDFGIDVIELKRDFVEISPGKYEEINIIGKGRRNSEEIWILGECKTQLVKKDVDNFLKKMAKIESILPGERLLLLVTYQTPPQVANYIKEKGLKLYYSYQFPPVL